MAAILRNVMAADLLGNRLGSVLRELKRKRVPFLITENGEPSAVLLGVRDFDDIVEELDPEFRKSLKSAAAEYRTGQVIPLRQYLRERRSRRRTGK
jgi:prevent-host-death family protein